MKLRIERHTVRRPLKGKAGVYTYHRVVASKRIEGCKYPQKIVFGSYESEEEANQNLDRLRKEQQILGAEAMLNELPAKKTVQ